MRERPVLMSGPMVRALLAGKKTKTKTRRVVKPQPVLWRALTKLDECGGDDKAAVEARAYVAVAIGYAGSLITDLADSTDSSATEDRSMMEQFRYNKCPAGGTEPKWVTDFKAKFGMPGTSAARPSGKDGGSHDGGGPPAR